MSVSECVECAERAECVSESVRLHQQMDDSLLGA